MRGKRGPLPRIGRVIAARSGLSIESGASAQLPAAWPPPISRALDASDVPRERCQSGRLGQSRKLLWVQAYRGFESHPLRQTFLIIAAK